MFSFLLHIYTYILMKLTIWYIYIMDRYTELPLHPALTIDNFLFLMEDSKE